jgi:hypothetical protein
MNISFSGFEELNDKLSELAQSGTVKRNQFVAQQAEILLGKTKDNTPTDTGQLKNAWHRTTAVGGVVHVYNNTKYAAHVEYGHRVRAKKGGMTNKVIPGKKMLHLGMLQTGKSFKANADTMLKELLK